VKNQTNVKQVIYLTGMLMINLYQNICPLEKKVEDILTSGTYAMTALRAGIIVGSGRSVI
jgi:hypothetical protein